MLRSNHKAVIQSWRGVSVTPPLPTYHSLSLLLVFQACVMSEAPPHPPTPSHPKAGGGLNNGCPCISHTSLSISPSRGWMEADLSSFMVVPGSDVPNTVARHCQQIPVGVNQPPHPTPPAPAKTIFPHWAEAWMTSCCITNGPESQRLSPRSQLGKKTTIMMTQKHNCRQ